MDGANGAVVFREQGQKETSLAGVLSPVSKKKTGRAYVSLARAYSEKCVSPLALGWICTDWNDESIGENLKMHLSSTAEQRPTCQTTSNLKRGGYSLSFTSFY